LQSAGNPPAHGRPPPRADGRGIAGADDEPRLARCLLKRGAVELVFSILDNLVALAVAFELVALGLLVHRKLR
jgi:hypothetical protein